MYTLRSTPTTTSKSVGEFTGAGGARGGALALLLLASSGQLLTACTIPLSNSSVPGSQPSAVGRRGVPTSANSTKNYQDPVVIAELRERAVANIEGAMRSADAEVRANAVEAAAKLPSRLEHLVALGLTDENLGVRTVAAMTIGRSRLGNLAPAVGPLLADASPYVRSAGIFASVRNGKDVDQTPLADMVMNDSSTRVRSHVAFIIGEIGNISAAPMLRAASQVAPPRSSNSGPIDVQLMQLQIAEALIKLVDDEASIQAVRAALYASRPEDLEATALAVQVLGQVRDRKSVDNLIYLASYKDDAGNLPPAEVRLAVAGALARMGLPKGAFIADEYWTSEIPAVRAQCAFVYGETGGTQNLAHLDDLLADPDPRVQVAAAAGVLSLMRGGGSGLNR